jgi:hypothetical protein
MRAETHRIGQALLDHHRTVRKAPGVRVTDADVNRCLITYSALCERAGVPWLVRTVGSFLGELASWCSSMGYPPINALAVNATTRMPGDGYYGAEQCHEWPREVRECLAFQGYPAKMP